MGHEQGREKWQDPEMKVTLVPCVTLDTNGEELRDGAGTSMAPATGNENFPSSPRAEIRLQLVGSVIDEMQEQSKEIKDDRFQGCNSIVHMLCLVCMKLWL